MHNGADWKDLVHITIAQFIYHESFIHWNLELDACYEYLYNTPKKEQSLALIIDTLYQAYLKSVSPEAMYWGDKTPFNTLRLKWIRKVFPNAKYINIIRDGRDVVSSFLRSEIFKDIIIACERWAQSIDAVDRFKRIIEEDRIITVRYEELVRKPEENIRTICEFLNVEFDAGMISNKFVYLGDDNLDHLKNVKNPINDKSIGNWKKYLSEEQKDIVTKLLTKKLHSKNYLKN